MNAPLGGAVAERIRRAVDVDGEARQRVVRQPLGARPAAPAQERALQPGPDVATNRASTADPGTAGLRDARSPWASGPLCGGRRGGRTCAGGRPPALRSVLR